LIHGIAHGDSNGKEKAADFCLLQFLTQFAEGMIAEPVIPREFAEV
jgi:hypothetical protein